MIVPFPFERYTPAQVQVRRATEAWEIAGCRALRRRVFCDEQRIFADDDVDEIDAVAVPLAAVSMVGGMPSDVVGTVRIHEAADGVWFGSRLAVQTGMRRMGGIGTQLIRLAVCLGHAGGARHFRAHVQQQNVALFRSLHWHSICPVALHGHPHELMQADLSHYPASAAREIAVFRPIADAA